MIRLHISAVLAVCSLTACMNAQSQSGAANPSEPRVVVVPPDELSRTPSLSPATTGTVQNKPATPAVPVASVAVQKPASPSPTKHVYNSCNVPDSTIAITFDDGPHPQLTPKLLDILKERNIHATFYVIGKNVEAYPEIVKRMVAEGHEVGNHTWNHPSLTKLSASKVESEMNDTTRAIEAAIGSKPKTMRPPYGATNATLNKRHDEEFGMKVILWSVDPMDWKYRNAARVSSQIIENTKPGAIVLAHDIHASTVDAMPKTLDALLAKGFKFATVSELLAMDRPVELVKKDSPAQP